MSYLTFAVDEDVDVGRERARVEDPACSDVVLARGITKVRACVCVCVCVCVCERERLVAVSGVGDE